MSEFLKRVHGIRETKAEEDQQRKLRCAEDLYEGMVKEIGETGELVRHELWFFDSCEKPKSGNERTGPIRHSNQYHYTKPADVKFFKDYLEKESGHNVSCQIKSQETPILRCVLKD